MCAQDVREVDAGIKPCNHVRSLERFVYRVREGQRQGSFETCDDPDNIARFIQAELTPNLVYREIYVHSGFDYRLLGGDEFGDRHTVDI